MHSEALETRRLMSVSLSSGGTLSAVGTKGDDVITMTVANGTLKVVDNGKAYAFAVAKVKQIYADAGAGADTIRLDPTVKVPATLVAGVGEAFNSSNDFLYGGGGNDRLVGNERTAEMHGGGGNDVVEANGETASYGDAGNDKLVRLSGSSAVFDGGAGNDTLDASGVRFGETLGNQPDLDAGGYLSPAAYHAIENWVGTAYDDTIVGGDGRNILRGNGGNDTIVANGGDDELYGGAGDDVLYGGSGADALFGEAGNDTLYARDGAADFLAGGYGTDRAKRDGADTVTNVEIILA